MPNWVYNWIGIKGPKDDVAAFVKDAASPRPVIQWEQVDGVGWAKHIKWIGDEPFCYWNFVTPEPDIVEEYFHYDEKEVVNKENWWYNWNIANWGCKWDAGEAEITSPYEEIEDKQATVSYKFDSPWGPPDGVFNKIIETYPTLKINIEYEEEQGWGGRLQAIGGVVTSHDTWDIPGSHADYEERGNPDGCICSWEDNSEYWFTDCPKDDLTEEEINEHKEAAIEQAKQQEERLAEWQRAQEEAQKQKEAQENESN